MKNLILIIGDNTYQFDKMDEIYDNILGQNNGAYSTLDEESKSQRRYDMAFLNANCNPDLIGYLTKTSAEDLATARKIFIDNDEVYLLSILRAGAATLLASRDTELAKEIGVTDNSQNYMIVNSFTEQLLRERRNQLLHQKGISRVNHTKLPKPNFSTKDSNKEAEREI